MRIKEVEAIIGERVIKLARWLLGTFPHLSRVPSVCEPEGPPTLRMPTSGQIQSHHWRMSYFTTIFKLGQNCCLVLKLMGVYLGDSVELRRVLRRE